MRVGGRFAQFPVTTPTPVGGQRLLRRIGTAIAQIVS